MTTLLSIVGGCIAAVVGLVLVQWRRAKARADELEAAKLAHSFEVEAIADAERKKKRIAERLAQKMTAVDAMTPAELEDKVNE